MEDSAFEYKTRERPLARGVTEIVISLTCRDNLKVAELVYIRASSYLDFLHAHESLLELQDRFLTPFDDLLTSNSAFSNTNASFSAIESLYVLPAFRGIKLGARLINTILSDVVVLLPASMPAPGGFPYEEDSSILNLRAYYGCLGFTHLRRAHPLIWRHFPRRAH